MAISYGTARKIIGDIFFAAIIAVGLEKFFDEFYSQHKKFFLAPSLHFISNAPAFFNVVSFITVFFWAIAQWLVYNDEVSKSKGSIRVRALVIYIMLFSLIFLILNISIRAYELTSLFIISILAWHLANLGLHFIKKNVSSDNEESEFIYREIGYIIVYFTLFLILHFANKLHDIILIFALIATNVNSLLYISSLNRN